MSKNRGGRPPIGPRITVNFPSEVITEMTLAAGLEEKTRSEWLREAVAKQLNTTPTTTKID